MSNPFENIETRLEKIENLILELKASQDSKIPELEIWFNVDELCSYLPDKPKKPTVYGWVSNGEVPYHKGTKKLRFLKSEIDEWLKLGRVKTFAEVENEIKKRGKNEKRNSKPGI